MADDLSALVAELRALEAKATPRPWEFDPENVGKSFDSGYGILAGLTEGSFLAGHEVLSVVCSNRFVERHGVGVAEANAGLVVAARNALPTLLSALEQAQRERDEARDRLRAFIGSVEEMSLGEGVPAGLVVIDPGSDSPRAVHSSVTREWYEAIMVKWHRDEPALIAMYDRHRHDAAELNNARERIATLEAARGADFGLTFAEFRRINVQRCEGPTFNHNVADWSPAEWACALAGEVGEACNLIKKMRRGDDVDIGDIGRELGDVQAYLDLLAARLGLDLQEWVVRKFNEVSERRGAAERIHIGGPHVHRPDGELRPDGSDRCADCGEKFTRAALRAGKEGQDAR